MTPKERHRQRERSRAKHYAKKRRSLPNQVEEPKKFTGLPIFPQVLDGGKLVVQVQAGRSRRLY